MKTPFIAKLNAAFSPPFIGLMIYKYTETGEGYYLALAVGITVLLFGAMSISIIDAIYETKEETKN